MDVTVARIYLTEGEHLQQALVRRLHDEEGVRGVTVFRGISGFGQSRRIHGSGLLDIALDLPVVVEFFDEPQTVDRILHDLADLVPEGHVLTFAARLR